MARRRFRFGVQLSRAKSREAWAEKARKAEDLGYSTLFVPDHFDDQFAPMVAMMSAADATTTLRVGSLVFDNDYKHPVVMAKEAATLDVLSGGRLEFGIGAGWMKSDYEHSGIMLESPGARIEKLKEAVAIVKGLWGDGRAEVSGKYYTVSLEGTPKPVQQPHPPLLIGGGGKRVLSFAAREADIVGVNFNLEQGAVNTAVMASGSRAATEEKIGWIRKAAGARFDDLELNVTVFVSIITDDRQKMAERVAGGFGMPPGEVLQVPHNLIGTVDEIVEDLQRRREMFGFTYIVISGDAFEPMAPVVKKLAGT